MLHKKFDNPKKRRVFPCARREVKSWSSFARRANKLNFVIKNITSPEGIFYPCIHPLCEKSCAHVWTAVTRFRQFYHFFFHQRNLLIRWIDIRPPSVTRRFFFKLPIGGVKIAKKSPAFFENKLKSPEFWAKIAVQNPVFSVLLHFYYQFFCRCLKSLYF